MKHFSKLAVFLLACPLPAFAQSQDQIYLVVFAKASGGITSELIPMRNMEACNAAGVKLMGNNKNGGNIQGIINAFRVGYDCVNGVR